MLFIINMNTVFSSLFYLFSPESRPQGLILKLVRNKETTLKLIHIGQKLVSAYSFSRNSNNQVICPRFFENLFSRFEVLYNLVLFWQMRSSEQKGSKKQLSLQDFQIEYKLGEGAYGYVFLASRHNEQFAIKEMNKFKLKRQHRQYQPIIEKEVLRAINHPGIIKNFCAFQNTNYLYLVLEYCPDSHLEPLIKNNQLTEESRKFYVAELVNIIEYLHSHGIIHRDLKPSNLLLSKERHLKVIDFGTADITNSDLVSESFKDKISHMKPKKKENDYQAPREKVTLKKKSTFVGTTEFLSPQLIERSQSVPASDLWALGCIIYYLYYGHGPFQQTSEFQAYKLIQTGYIAFPKNQSVSEEALDLMTRLLVKQPQKRLGSCSCEQLSFAALKRHPYFRGINVDTVFQSEPPQINTPQSQIQEKLMELKLQANLSFKEPGFGNALEKILVKIDEDKEGIYLCHFKKELKLVEYQTISADDQPTTYNLCQDQDRKVAHLLSQNKFSIGIVDGQRLIYSSKDSKSICLLLNDHYSNKGSKEITQE